MSIELTNNIKVSCCIFNVFFSFIDHTGQERIDKAIESGIMDAIKSGLDEARALNIGPDDCGTRSTILDKYIKTPHFTASAKLFLARSGT